MFSAALVVNEPESLVERKPCNCTALHTAASVCSSTFGSPFSRVVEEPHRALWLTSDCSAQAGSARRVSACLESRRGRDHSRRPSLCCDGSLRSADVFVALGKNLSTSVWSRDDVYGYELAAAPRRSPGVCRRFHRVDVAAYHHRHIAAPMSLARDGTCGRRGEVSHRRPVPSLSPARPLCAPYKSGFDR